jgi:hypothetical protein
MNSTHTLIKKEPPAIHASIVEIRRYRVRRGSAMRVIGEIHKALPQRQLVSPILGLWRAVSGDDDGVIHIWPYASLNERASLREQAASLPNWPPAIQDDLMEMQTDIVSPFFMSYDIGLREAGIYEFCSDLLHPSSASNHHLCIASRQKKLHGLGRLLLAGRTEFGLLNRWLHLWVYPTVSDWMESRSVEATCPDSAVGGLVSRQSTLALSF